MCVGESGELSGFVHQQSRERFSIRCEFERLLDFIATKWPVVPLNWFAGQKFTRSLGGFYEFYTAY